MAGQSIHDRARQERNQPGSFGTQLQILRRNKEIRVGRERRVAAMQRRMPFTLVTIPDPLITDEIQDDEPNDSQAVTNFIWNEYLNGRSRNYPCEIARRGNLARQGGAQPTDEPHAVLSVSVPGEIPFSVKISDVAILLEEPQQRIYTIIRISADRLSYMTTIEMEEFAHRAAAIT